MRTDVLVALVCASFVVVQSRNPFRDCYDRLGNPQRCLCDFENRAFGLEVEATNTCGEEEPSVFCVQTGSQTNTACQNCTKGDHPPSAMTDLQTHGNITWWQSETMAHGLQYPSSVNLTFNLNKAYDITYVRIVFQSPRPESFAIYKRTKKTDPWVPYQYYSADCRNLYGLEDRAYALESDETAPLCTSAYSDISPLSGGAIAFATLEGRKSALVDFDHNVALHDWVTATEIRIQLNRMNTFGDEWHGGENVFLTYYYAISDVSIGARCKCNGHASNCDPISLPDGSRGRRCRCEHNTAGDDCERCADFYQDTKWKRATASDAGVCKPCNCNGFSTRCIFDEELWEKTGHGGRCIECSANRDGPNCERCRDNYYLSEDNECLPCYCNDIGSRSLQCSRGGKCDCKPGVTGEKCDICAADYYDFGSSGCKECNCLTAGSWNNEPSCDQTLGKCECKDNVEGKECSSCKPGYFNLDEENKFGCTPCFCYGHATVCSSEPGYTKSLIESVFARNSEKWSAVERGVELDLKEIRYNAKAQDIAVEASGRDPVYFSAPDKFLGDQKASYNQELHFKLKVGNVSEMSSNLQDIILEGNNLAVSQAIFGNGNSLPSTQDQIYKFTLHENPDYGWVPRLPARDFMSILSNLTAIKIRGTYSPRGTGFLDAVKMGTAIRGGTGKPANWIERCQCPEGYISQFCESCAPGYRHDPPGGGPFSVCIPCNCNNHTDSCDPDTGKCICQHNTGGNNCERCARGFYGNALAGTPNDCQPCPCPNKGACYQLKDSTVVCIECPKGYAGARCDQCTDGYFGEVDAATGKRTCTACDCNSNVDVNAVNNCNRTTGECLKCIFNTAGFHCDQCLPGFYGDPLAVDKGDCKPCDCDTRGTEGGEDGGPFLCNQLTGQCQCKSNVTGAKCDQCKAGYFNIESGKGCQPCNCNVTGSTGPSCNDLGQCNCQPGVTGLQCNECEKNQFGFSSSGCQPCECDTFGSADLQCNSTGHCPCLENVEGRHCDRCKENKYDRKSNCRDCPPCYNLVKDEVDRLRSNLKKLDDILQKIIISPTSLNDENYQSKVEEVKARVEQLLYDAKRNVGDDVDLAANLEALKKLLDEMNKSLDEISVDADKAEAVVKEAEQNATDIGNKIQETKKDIWEARRYIDTEGSLALERAKKRSQETGQGNEQMSMIAHEARTIVEKQIQEARDTEKAAEKAVETCDEAYKLSLLVKEKQMNASRDLEELEGKLTNVKTAVNTMLILGNETMDKVNASYQEVSAFAVDINNIQDPKVDASKLIAESERYRQEAERLMNESRSIEDTHLKDTGDVDNALRKSEGKLEDAKTKQQELDGLMAEADAARNRAKEAVELGKKTVKDAQYTLEILQHSDDQIQRGKENAMKEIERIPQIQAILREAQEKTHEASEALAGAESNANKASLTALHAQNETAAAASKQAKSIRERAEQAKNDASKLKDDADNLSAHVADTSQTLNDKSERVDKFINFTKEAKEKVATARTKADEVFKEVDGAANTLKKILKDLEDLSDIDEDRLNALETRLLEVERQYENSNFDDQMTLLNNARILQDQQIKSYEEEVEKLKKEVDKVEAIRNALPGGCFNRPNLEQL